VTKKGKKFSYQRLRPENDEVIKIGKNISPDEMTHEFIGIAKFSKEGARKLIQIYEDLVENHEGRFHESDNLDMASDTDILQELIDRGIKVSIYETNGGWIEIHTEKDIKIAEDILRI
jgi:NDP-sugar pyrophosphorylase family protein